MPRDPRVRLGGLDYDRTVLDSIPHPRPGVALAMSAVGVLAPLAGGTLLTDIPARASGPAWVILACGVISPSAGYLYAGLNRRALIASGVRGVGFGIFTVSMLHHRKQSLHAFGATTGTAASGDAQFGATLGLTIMLTSGLMDAATVAGDVDRANAERVGRRATVGIRPLPSGNGPALAVTLHY
jgi:hypothetical protein